MSKYERLGDYLRERGAELVPMTFADIERVVGTKLPKSRKHQAWWSNSISNNVMTQVWLDAGYRTEQVDVAHERLVFRRVAEAARGGAMQEESRMFVHESEPKSVSSHPMVGALKGTFTIAPGWDLTKPALDLDELADWEASLDRKARMIEKGLSGKRG